MGNGDNITQPIVLKTISGGKWEVKFAKIKDGYYFVDGWFDFVKQNRLEKHDFVVFWLISPPSNVIFQVFFYALNECLKEPLTGSNNDIHPIAPNVGHRSDDSGARDGNKPCVVKETNHNGSLTNRKLFERIVCRTYLNYMRLTKDFERVTGIDCNIVKRVRLMNDDGKKFKVTITTWKRGLKSVPIPHLTGGWSEFLKDNNVEIGDICVFNHVKRTLLHVHVEKGKKRGRRSNKSNE
ncbi:putative B3 domain-containing protein [Tanacetum coccineum]